MKYYKVRKGFEIEEQKHNEKIYPHLIPVNTYAYS